MKNFKKIKQTTILFLTLFCVHFFTFAQGSYEDYVKQQQQAFTNYTQTQKENYKKYVDSLNQKYAEYLAQQWKNFELFKNDPLIKNPIPKPPIFDNSLPTPEPVEIPIIKPKPEPKPQPIEEPKPVPPPAPVDKYPIKTVFFGTTISLKEMPKSTIHLLGTSEKEVAGYWSALAKVPHYADWKNEALRLKNDLQLNEWGLYQLLNRLFLAYFPQGNENEQVFFSIFMLNQLGYRAKIGRTANELVPLIAFQNEVYNTPYFMNSADLNVKYSVINPKQKNLSSIQTCQIDYEGAKNNINMNITKMPHFAVNLKSKMLKEKQIQYNQNVVDFCVTYPCVDFSIYAEAALDEFFWKSIEAQIAPVVRNKSQEEAVNWLLNFVQNAFKYKTDEEQFGYEKWNFAEETIASEFSDCEDRSILFAQLVRRLLNMPVVLVYYPNVHLATAVKFSNPATNGDYFIIDGEKYLICDPTYINASLGMAMPNLKNVPAEVVKLRR